MRSVNTAPTKRGTYHHGDLASALTEVATDLARTGGPDAIVLREAARRVGVSATAAYRHFAGQHELLDAVRDHAHLALATAMRERVATGAPLDDEVADAIRRLRAIGTAYVEWALAEPGLFHTAFCPPEPSTDAEAMASMVSRAAPYILLAETVEELDRLGALPAERRAYAEIHLWTSVHGLAVLMVDGPLRIFGPDEQAALIEHTIDFCEAGLGLNTAIGSGVTKEINSAA
jgi:AcrR family transcriptional regulator